MEAAIRTVMEAIRMPICHRHESNDIITPLGIANPSIRAEG